MENPNPQEPIPVVSQPEPEKDLYSWTAPSRPFKKRNREFYTTIATLVILLSVILLFAKEFLLIGVILSFGFVSYVLATVPPGKVSHRLTNKGIRTGEKSTSGPPLAATGGIKNGTKISSWSKTRFNFPAA
jgi:predicted DNA-binding transcriptional regulator